MNLESKTEWLLLTSFKMETQNSNDQTGRYYAYIECHHDCGWI